MCTSYKTYINQLMSPLNYHIDETSTYDHQVGEQSNGIPIIIIIIGITLMFILSQSNSYSNSIQKTTVRNKHITLLSSNKRKIKSINHKNLDHTLISRIEDLEDGNDIYYLFIVDNFWLRYQDPMLDFHRNRILDINDDKGFLRMLSYTYRNRLKLKIIMETTGGNVRASDILSKSILNYPYGSEVYIPNYSFSAGTFIALSADELYMNIWAFLGPVDVQIPNKDSDMYPSRDLIHALYNKDDLLDDTYLIAVRAEMDHKDNLDNLDSIFQTKSYSRTQIRKLKDCFASGKHPHHKPFSVKELVGMGISVISDVGSDITQLYDAYKDVESVF